MIWASDTQTKQGVFFMEFCNSDGQILSDFDDKKQMPFLTDYSPNDKSWDSHKAFCDNVSAPMLASEKLSHQKQGKRIADLTARAQKDPKAADELLQLQIESRLR